MKKIIYLWITTLFSIVLLFGCTSNNHTTPKQEAQTHDNVAEREGADQTQNHTNANNQQKDNHQDDHGETSQEKTPTNIKSQLKMDNDKIILPAKFPGHQQVGTNIDENTSSEYMITYQTPEHEQIATFTGKSFSTAGEAKANLADFMDGKEVPENSETAIDLGHGITGYGEGAAGHAYFSWQEGNWTLSIASLTQDEMDHPAIAKIMVDFLETHYLPAPKDMGIVDVNYPNGGNAVDVDIRFQEDNMVYQLQTNEVPVDALSTTVSVK